MKRKQNSVRGLLILPVLLAQGAASASAADITWSGTTGSYNNAANWTGGVVPGLADRAISNKGTNNAVQVNVGDPDWTVGRIVAGLTSGGAFQINGATLNTSNSLRAVMLGAETGSSGLLTMNGGTLNFTNTEFTIGQLGKATVNLNGGTISGQGTIAVNVGTSLDAVNATMDGGLAKTDFTWYEQTFFPSDPTRGLPAAGSVVPHESLSDHSYKFAPSYSQNNSVMLSAGVTNATITFPASTSATGLSFLGSSGNGDVNVNYTITHADNSKETGTMLIRDWFSNDGVVAYRVGGRVRVTGFDFQTITDGPNKPYLLSTDITASGASAITKIDLEWVSGGIASIYAVSASSGGNYDPVTISGYNADMVMNNPASVYVDTSIVDTVNQTGGSILTTGEMWVGNYGKGEFNMSGGTNTIQNWTAFGRSGGNGVWNMTGGEFNKSGNGSLLIGSGHQALLGATPSGVLNHSGGVINDQNQFLCPENSPATGTYNISGTAVMNVNDWFVIGRNGGQGTMMMTGGTINKTGGGNFAIGDGTSAVGYADQSAGAVNVIGGELFVGNNNSMGTWDLKGGSITVNNWTVIGRDNGTGMMNISGGTLTKTGNSGNHFIIGGNGPGTLNQTAGSVVSTLSETWIGENRPGTWTMTGGTASLAGLRLGLNTGSEGNLTIDSAVMSVEYIQGGAGMTAVNLNGAKLIATANSQNFIAGLGSATIGGNGLTIDSAGFDLVASQAFLNGGGGITKLGLGSLTLSGANTYAGPTVVNAGKVVLSSASSGAGDLTVANGAGSGIIVASANGQMTVPNATLGTSTMEFDLGGFGNPTSAPLNVSGAFTVNGVITVNIADALPQVGQLPLIAFGSRAGAGSFVVGTLPTGVNATIATNGNAIVLNISNVNLPRWNGTAGGTWDIGATANWVNIGTGAPTYYGEGNFVLFDDAAEGVTDVNLVTTVKPGNVTINNGAKNYTLYGTGKIDGKTSVVKNGTGAFAIASSVANTYTGPTIINSGMLVVSNLANGGSASAIGASSSSPTNLVIGSATLSYAGAPVNVNRGFRLESTNSTIDVQTSVGFGGQIASANGTSLIKTGPGVLAFTGSGSNIIAGGNTPGISVERGTVKFDGSSGAQSNRIVTELWVGSSTNFGGSLELTNTSLYVDAWLSVGRGNGSINNKSSLKVYNSSVSANGISFGWWKNLEGNLATQDILLAGNSTITNRGGNTLNIAESGGSTTTVTIKDNSVFYSGPRCVIAFANATGTVSIANSGQLVVNSYFSIANENNARASVSVVDNGLFYVRDDFNVSDTGSSEGSLFLGGNSVANGGTVYIGKADTSVGNTIITNSATLTSRGHTRVAMATNSKGSVKMYGGKAINANELWVGENGNATWDQTGGEVWSTNWVAIGRNTSGIGVYNISGGSLNEWNTGSRLIVGSSGNGTLNMSGTAKVSSRGAFQVGENSSATGLVNLGQGTTLTVPRIYGGSGASTLNFNGGTLIAASGANADFMSGIKNVNVVSNAVIDSGANTINVSAALLDGGYGSGLIKLGTGTLNLNGANTYTGATTVNEGGIGGNGVILGALNVGVNGTLAPGTSVGVLTVNNGVSLAGSTVMEVGKVAGALTNDLLVVAGNLSMGGTLNIVLASGTQALVVNDTFDLFNWATRNGTFGTVYLPAGYLWDTSNLYVNGTVRVSAVVPPGPNPPTVVDGKLILTGTGGTPGSSYTWLSSTNAAAPVATWVTNTVGVFDANGSYSNAITINPNELSRFFRLKLP